MTIRQWLGYLRGDRVGLVSVVLALGILCWVLFR
jgi:hypothetical protein